MSYKQYKWEVIAKDYFSPLFRNYLWTQSFFRQAELLGVPRAILGIVSKENAIEYITDISTWMKTHEALKKSVVADCTVLEKLLETTEAWGKSMTEWTESNVFLKQLKDCSAKELTSLLCECITRQETAYAYGTAVTLLDFANFSFVEGNLEKILRAKVSPEEYNEYYRVFTYPISHSFGRDQEVCRLKLMQEFFSDTAWRQDVINKTPQEVQHLHPDFWRKLETHTQAYGWVYYVYMGPVFTEKQFLEFIRQDIVDGIDPEKKLIDTRRAEDEIRDTKAEYIQKLQLTDKERAIVNLSGWIVWAKPRRKDYQSKLYYHVEKLQREIARRLAFTLDQVRSCPVDMLVAALEEGVDIDVHLINSIQSFHVCIPNDDGSVSVLTGKDAEAFSSTVLRKVESENSDVREIMGTIGCPGKATGIVRIVNVPNDMAKLKERDILVSTATTPSIVAAMKRAGAIVTDEGGLTCHAAIVSRELNVPCVIGTKIATRVLKDGDMVEVDATKGIVRKISE